MTGLRPTTDILADLAVWKHGDNWTARENAAFALAGDVAPLLAQVAPHPPEERNEAQRDRDHARSAGGSYKRRVDALNAERSDLLNRMAAVADTLETRIEYGHQTVEFGWVPEHRGIKYASHQRTVHWRAEEPLLIDHWSDPDGVRKPFDSQPGQDGGT